MPLAIDTVVGTATNPGGTFTAVTPNTGDSTTVRNAPTTSSIMLEQVVRAGATGGAVRVRSPLLHDDVQGLHWLSEQNPSVLLMPPQAGQKLRSGDNLIVELTGGTAETDLAALVIYYSDLPGAQARLHSWGDIAGNIANIETIHVTASTGATPGVWTDTPIIQTENLLKADTDYAVLGYVVFESVAGVVGVRGSETGNLRVCGPSTSDDFETSYFFVDQSQRHQTPHIPVFNSNNRASFYLSTALTPTSQADVTLVCAQLATKLNG
jgi:hypothetical protein